MRVSKDPMEPLRCWKELLVGERAFRAKKALRFFRRRCTSDNLVASAAH